MESFEANGLPYGQWLRARSSGGMSWGRREQKRGTERSSPRVETSADVGSEDPSQAKITQKNLLISDPAELTDGVTEGVIQGTQSKAGKLPKELLLEQITATQILEDMEGEKSGTVNKERELQRRCAEDDESRVNFLKGALEEEIGLQETSVAQNEKHENESPLANLIQPKSDGGARPWKRKL